jgi:hypothetical protein
MAEMAPPSGQDSGSGNNIAPQRPTGALQNTQSASNAIPTEGSSTLKKRRNHRGGKRKKNRRQSFAAGPANLGTGEGSKSNLDLLEPPASTSRPTFYRLGQSGRNMSSTSLDSEALLDHRYADSSLIASKLGKGVSNPIICLEIIRRCELAETVSSIRMLTATEPLRVHTSQVPHIDPNTRTLSSQMRDSNGEVDLTEHTYLQVVRARKMIS